MQISRRRAPVNELRAGVNLKNRLSPNSATNRSVGEEQTVPLTRRVCGGPATSLRADQQYKQILQIPQIKKSECRKSQSCSMCAGCVQCSGRSQLDGCPAEGAGEDGEASILLSRRELSLQPADEGVRSLEKKKHNISIPRGHQRFFNQNFALCQFSNSIINFHTLIC